MKTQVARTALFVSTTFIGLVAILLCGCQAKQKASQVAATDNGFNVRIDRSENGAAAPAVLAVGRKSDDLPRTLAFTMSGAGRMPESGVLSAQRAAANQAAIIEAFCRAVAEARGGGGQQGSDFTADFGPRLKVTQTTVDGDCESRVTLISRGVETTFVVRNGTLQHEPQDLRQIQQIFGATNGEFSLLGTDWSPLKGECVATVAHYLPADLDSALAGSVPNAEGDSPAEPAPAQ